MEPKQTDISGCAVTIKLMDSSYIMCEDEQRKDITVDLPCRTLSPCWPNPLYSLYYRKLLEAYGLGPVLCWDGKKRIVGFLPIGVTDCGLPQPSLCIHYTGGITYAAERHVDAGMMETAVAIPFDRLKTKEIRIACMSVHHSLRGNNLGAMMIQYIVAWAKQNGWDRVTGRAMLDGEPMAFYPTHSFWIRQGFKPVGEVRRFGLTSDPYDRARSIDLTVDLT